MVQGRARSAIGRGLTAFGLAALVAISVPSPVAAQEDCLDCHGQPLTETEGPPVNLTIDGAALEGSVHGGFPCSFCHTEQPHRPEARTIAYDSCSRCHPGHDFGPDAAGVFSHPNPPLDCESCHGSIHAIVRSDDPGSPLSRQRNVEYCGGCHSAPTEAYLYSYHGSAHTLGSATAPVCADCHGHLPIVDPDSKADMVDTETSCGGELGCHVGSQRSLAKLVNSGAHHVTPFTRQAGVDGASRWAVWKLFLLIILGNVTKDGAVIFFDLFRRLRRGGSPPGGRH